VITIRRPQPLRASKGGFSIKTNSMQEAERALADKVAQIVRLSADLSARSLTANSQGPRRYWMRVEAHRDVPSPAIVPFVGSQAGKPFEKAARQPSIEPL
jgi:hypothetical protein